MLCNPIVTLKRLQNNRFKVERNYTNCEAIYVSDWMLDSLLMVARPWLLELCTEFICFPLFLHKPFGTSTNNVRNVGNVGCQERWMSGTFERRERCTFGTLMIHQWRSEHRWYSNNGRNVKNVGRRECWTSETLIILQYPERRWYNIDFLTRYNFLSESLWNIYLLITNKSSLLFLRISLLYFI